jgi:cytochrome P450
MAHTLFSSPDEVWHRQLRKSISAAFTVGAAASYEYLVDNTVRVYLDDLGKRYSARPGPEGVIDLHTSLLYFAFDVIGDLTYGSRYGFIESGKDVNGIIHYVVSFLNYGFIVSIKFM